MFFLVQRYILHSKDIFADQLMDDRIVEQQQGTGQLPTGRCCQFPNGHPLLHLQLSRRRRHVPGGHQKPLEHREQPALGSGCGFRRGSQPSENGTRRPQPGGDTTPGSEPPQAGTQRESRYQSQTQKGRLGLRISDESPIPMKCDCPEHQAETLDRRVSGP